MPKVREVIDKGGHGSQQGFLGSRAYTLKKRRKIFKRLLHGHNIRTYPFWLQDKVLEPKNGSYCKNQLII